MSLTDAIEREVAGMPKDVRESSLAALALLLAEELVAPNSATSKSMNARVLFDVLNRLRDLAPKEDAKDDLDELAERRRVRLSNRSAAT